MGNTGLLRREAEMTLLQPHSSGTEEFAFLAFLIVQVSASKGGRRLPPLSGLRTVSEQALSWSPQEAPTGNAPMGATPPKTVINRFPQSGKWNNRGSRDHFRSHPRGQGCGNPSPNDSSIASLSPPVGGRLHSFRRDWQINKCSNSI